jgi:hypothetical protein
MTVGKDPDIIEGGTGPREDVQATYTDATSAQKAQIWRIA